MAPDNRWPEAERRDALLAGFLKTWGWQLTREVVEAAREELGIPRSTLFRLVARFRRTKRTTSLLPQATGTPSAAKRLDPKIESFITEQIDLYWLKKERPTMSSLASACTTLAALKVGDPRTVARSSDASMNSSRVLWGIGEGRGISWRRRRQPWRQCGERPQRSLAIDHTIVDVIVVDEQLRRPIGRPDPDDCDRHLHAKGDGVLSLA